MDVADGPPPLGRQDKRAARWYEVKHDRAEFDDAVSVTKANDLLELDLRDRQGVVAGQVLCRVSEKFRLTPDGLCLAMYFVAGSSQGLDAWMVGLSRPLYVHLCRGPVHHCDFDIVGRAMVHCGRWRLRRLADVTERWMIKPLPAHDGFDEEGGYASDEEEATEAGGTWASSSTRASPPVSTRPANVGGRSRRAKEEIVREEPRSDKSLRLAPPSSDGIMGRVAAHGNQLLDEEGQIVNPGTAEHRRRSSDILPDGPSRCRLGEGSPAAFLSLHGTGRGKGQSGARGAQGSFGGEGQERQGWPR